MSEESQDQKEFYLKVMRSVISRFSEMLGEEVSYRYAREAPLQIEPDGDVKDFYGDGEKALELLFERYEEIWGEVVTKRKVRSAIRGSVEPDDYDRLPEAFRPDEDGSRR